MVFEGLVISPELKSGGIVSDLGIQGNKMEIHDEENETDGNILSVISSLICYSSYIESSL